MGAETSNNIHHSEEFGKLKEDMRMNKETRGVVARLMQFFVVGLIMGITEDLIAIKFATDARITWQTIRVAFFVALPFAVVSDLVVDRKFFRGIVRKFIIQR